MKIKLRELVLLKVTDNTLFVTSQDESESVIMVQGPLAISLFELISNTVGSDIPSSFCKKWEQVYALAELKKLLGLFSFSDTDIELNIPGDSCEIKLVGLDQQESLNTFKAALVNNMVQHLDVGPISTYALCDAGDQNFGDFSISSYGSDCQAGNAN